MKRFSLLGLLFMAAMLWGGGQGLYTVVTNLEPTPMTCAELEKNTPKATWLRLADCEVDWEHAGYSGLTEARELYLPLRAPGAAEGSPARVVLESEDAALLGFVRALTGKSSDKASPIPATSTYEGLIQFGIDLKDSKRQQVKEVTENVIEDFVILKHNEKPRPLFSGGMFAAGLFLLGFFIYRWRSKPPEEGLSAPVPKPNMPPAGPNAQPPGAGPGSGAPLA